MNIRATTEFKFLIKFLLIGVACLAYAAWALYDGLVGYPNQIPRAAAWEQLNSDVPEESVDDELWARIVAEQELSIEPESASQGKPQEHTKRQLWKLIAEKNGWNEKTPAHDESVAGIQHKIDSQFLILAVAVLCGLPCLIWYMLNRNKWIESTDNGLRSSWGQELQCSQIKTFDKAKWEKKGIGVLYYNDATGAECKFVLDDLKYQRKPMDQIVEWVESQIEPDQIVNGFSEAMYEKLKLPEDHYESDIVSDETETE